MIIYSKRLHINTVQFALAINIEKGIKTNKSICYEEQNNTKFSTAL